MARTPSRFPIHQGQELRAFLAACHANPDDDTPRLVLADWLQEHDDPRGEVMRLQCQLAALPAGDPRYDDLMARHEQWWKSHRGRWDHEGAWALWDTGPHDRGLPTFGHYEDESAWLNTDDLPDPAKKPKAHLSRTVAEGWPGMTWVLPMAFAEFDEYDQDDDDDYEDFDEYDQDDDDDYEDDDGEFEDRAERPHTRGAADTLRDPYRPFREPPWAGSPAPVGITFPDGMIVTPEHIDLAAAVPNLRGLSLSETTSGPRLLPHIAKLTALEHLDLGIMRFGDAGVRTLAPLTRLRTLISQNATFTNAGAAGLAGFTELRDLRISTRRLTAAGYKSLAALTKLEVLELDKADDAALRHLAPLNRLRRLRLSSTDVTGAGVENFPLLTELRLESTPADDAGLAGLASLVRLRALLLDATKITGATLAHLRGLRWLNELYLSQTGLRDKDLVHLEGLKHLESLSLWGTNATKKGIGALKAKLKKTTVM